MAVQSLSAPSAPRQPRHTPELSERLAVAHIEAGLAAHWLAVDYLQQAGARAAGAKKGKRHA